MIKVPLHQTRNWKSMSSNLDWGTKSGGDHGPTSLTQPWKMTMARHFQNISKKTAGICPCRYYKLAMIQRRRGGKVIFSGYICLDIYGLCSGVGMNDQRILFPVHCVILEAHYTCLALGPLRFRKYLFKNNKMRRSCRASASI